MHKWGGGGEKGRESNCGKLLTLGEFFSEGHLGINCTIRATFEDVKFFLKNYNRSTR